MVLHNDKWARKAKRANERRKGITPGRGLGRGPSGKPLEQLSIQREIAGETGNVLGSAGELSDDDEDSSDSFEFDSEDEGKTEAERAVRSALRGKSAEDDASVLSQLKIEKKSTGSNQTEAKDLASLPLPESKADRRFARRKLVDNSSRYEEPILDPYLVVEDQPEQDYKSLTARHFSNPREEELIPDERNPSKAPQPMADTAHFDRLRQMQQKEEYARDMKFRFGQRRAPKMDMLSTAAHGHEENEFFDDIDNLVTGSADLDVSTDAKAGHRTESACSHTEQETGQLEQFLDDLLKI